MPITSSTSLQGTLTTSAATEIITGVAVSEFHSVWFTNYSGSDVTVDIYLNGTADVNRIGQALPLEADGGSVLLECRIGVGDKIHAKASAGTSVSWTDELTTP